MKKTPIILVHGWGGSKKSLEPLAKELESEGFSVHVLELPGHGNTIEMGRPWGMIDFANWLKKEKDRLKLDKYILIGHSFGGKTILAATTDNILHPEKIVLINSSGIKPKNTAKREIWKLLSQATKPIFMLPFTNKLRYFLYRLLIGETDYAKTSSNLRESFKIFVEEHFDDALKNIKIDTLVIWGKDDTSTPLWMGKIMATGIAGAKLEVMEGTHGLPLKEPKKVSKIITNFLND